jgi:hypothetical protein
MKYLSKEKKEENESRLKKMPSPEQAHKPRQAFLFWRGKIKENTA